MDKEPPPLFSQPMKHLGTATVTALTILAAIQGNWLTFNTGQSHATVEALAHTYERIGELEEQVQRLQGRALEDRVQLIIMQAQLDLQPDPLLALYAYIENIDYPAWIKEYMPETDEFIILYINREYEAVYDVERERYVGATDFEVHPPKMAIQYNQNDKLIMRTKGFAEFTEYSPLLDADGEAIKTVFWKFHVALPDDRELVAGIHIGEEGVPLRPTR